MFLALLFDDQVITEALFSGRLPQLLSLRSAFYPSPLSSPHTLTLTAVKSLLLILPPAISRLLISQGTSPVFRPTHSLSSLHCNSRAAAPLSPRPPTHSASMDDFTLHNNHTHSQSQWQWSLQAMALIRSAAHLLDMLHYLSASWHHARAVNVHSFRSASGGQLSARSCAGGVVGVSEMTGNDMRGSEEQSDEQLQSFSACVQALAYLCLLSAAWMDRRSSTVTALLAPAVTTAPDEPTPEPPLPRITSPSDVAAWLLSLDASRQAEGEGGEGPDVGYVEPGGFSAGALQLLSSRQNSDGQKKGQQSSKANTVPPVLHGDDLWSVLGMCVWATASSYVKRILSSSSSHSRLRAFGVLSPPLHSHSYSSSHPSPHFVSLHPNSSSGPLSPHHSSTLYHSSSPWSFTPTGSLTPTFGSHTLTPPHLGSPGPHTPPLSPRLPQEGGKGAPGSAAPQQAGEQGSSLFGLFLSPAPAAPPATHSSSLSAQQQQQQQVRLPGGAAPAGAGKAGGAAPSRLGPASSFSSASRSNVTHAADAPVQTMQSLISDAKRRIASETARVAVSFRRQLAAHVALRLPASSATSSSWLSSTRGDEGNNLNNAGTGAGAGVGDRSTGRSQLGALAAPSAAAAVLGSAGAAGKVCETALIDWLCGAQDPQAATESSQTGGRGPAGSQPQAVSHAGGSGSLPAAARPTDAGAGSGKEEKGRAGRRSDGEKEIAFESAACATLWHVLVQRRRVRSALETEGVDVSAAIERVRAAKGREGEMAGGDETDAAEKSEKGRTEGKREGGGGVSERERERDRVNGKEGEGAKMGDEWVKRTFGEVEEVTRFNGELLEVRCQHSMI